MYQLSLIIPIYNVESYIKDCIESVLYDLPTNVQVICVNDGTPDNSMHIVRSILDSCHKSVISQFKLIDQENKGLSGARNTGLDHADGRYIAFLDSDDKLEKEYFSKVIEAINFERPDILSFNLITSENEVIKVSDGSFDSVFNISRWYCPARIFSASLINGHRFTEGIHYEDVELTPKLYIEADKIVHLNSPLYWYRTNESSITQSYSENNNIKTLYSLEFVCLRYLDFYDKTNNPYYAVVTIHCYYVLVISALLRYDLAKSNTLIRKHHPRIKSIDLDSLPIHDGTFDSKIKFFLMSPLLYTRLYYSYRKVKLITETLKVKYR